MPELGMEKLFAAIGSAMNEAQYAVEEGALIRYLRHFQAPLKAGGARQTGGDGDFDDAITPKMQNIDIPNPDGSGVSRRLRVPLVTLYNHSTLELDQVKLRMKVSTSVDKDSGDLRVEIGPLKAAANPAADGEAQESKEDGLHEIELTFKRKDASEGIARVTQEAVKLL
jgi:hypothetical protein